MSDPQTASRWRSAVYGMSDIGFLREANEDSVVCVPLYRSSATPRELVFAAACDGMGGLAGGEIASRTAGIAALRFVSGAEWDAGNSAASEAVARDALVEAHRAVVAAAEEQGTRGCMGTTAVLAVMSCNQCVVGWTGDSRALLYRRGALNCITTDHSKVQAEVDAGVLTEEQAQHHPDRHLITRFLGQPGELTPDVASFELQEHDLVVLATDGVTGELEEREIRDVCTQALARACEINQEALRRIADELVDRVLARGAPDNTSIALLAPRLEEAASDQACSGSDIPYPFLNEAQLCLFR